MNNCFSQQTFFSQLEKQQTCWHYLLSFFPTRRDTPPFLIPPHPTKKKKSRAPGVKRSCWRKNVFFLPVDPVLKVPIAVAIGLELFDLFTRSLFLDFDVVAASTCWKTVLKPAEPAEWVVTCSCTRSLPPSVSTHASGQDSGRSAASGAWLY